jgi:hypothetical protein
VASCPSNDLVTFENTKTKEWRQPVLKQGAINQPLVPEKRKKGIWRQAKFPLVIQMVPKGGLARG